MNRFRLGALSLCALLAGMAAASAQPQQAAYGDQQDPYLVIQGQQPANTLSAGDFSAGAPRYVGEPHNPPPAPGYGESHPPASAPASGYNGYNNLLATRSGIQLGVQGSYYDYQEKDYGVDLNGGKFGLNAVGTLAVGDIGFVTADIRYALGDSDYKGSGTEPDNFEDLWDLRALAGHDFLFGEVSLSPYLGFGYRNLYSDERGTSSTGYGGYRRTNELYYLPFGVTPRLRLGGDSRLAATLEYDAVIHGNQYSQLSDVSPVYSDLNNSQNSGYGLRGDISYERGNWALGPFVDYWNIDASQVSCGATRYYTLCGFEPKNETFEAGFQIRYKVL